MKSNKFQPFGELVLVERLENPESKSGILLPGSGGRFWKVKIISAGFDTPDYIRAEFICMANPVPEIDNEKAFDNPDYVLMHFKHILGRWDNE